MKQASVLFATALANKVLPVNHILIQSNTSIKLNQSNQFVNFIGVCPRTPFCLHLYEARIKRGLQNWPKEHLYHSCEGQYDAHNVVHI